MKAHRASKTVLLARSTVLDGSPHQCRLSPNGYYPSTLVLISLTVEEWQAESTPPSVNSMVHRGFNTGLKGPKPATLTAKPTPGFENHQSWSNLKGEQIDFFFSCQLESVQGSPKASVFNFASEVIPWSHIYLNGGKMGNMLCPTVAGWPGVLHVTG